VSTASPTFNALHLRQHDEEVQLYAFDILALDGEDLRGLPLSLRKPKELADCAQPREAFAQNTKTANSAKGRIKTTYRSALDAAGPGRAAAIPFVAPASNLQRPSAQAVNVKPRSVMQRRS
jgi:hypothetical protein